MLQREASSTADGEILILVPNGYCQNCQGFLQKSAETCPECGRIPEPRPTRYHSEQSAAWKRAQTWGGPPSETHVEAKEKDKKKGELSGGSSFAQIRFCTTCKVRQHYGPLERCLECEMIKDGVKPDDCPYNRCGYRYFVFHTQKACLSMKIDVPEDYVNG